MSIKPCEPILDKGIHHTHFFNGRLLTAQDLETEKSAQTESLAQVGRAVGAGVATGLEVRVKEGADGAEGQDAVLTITGGLAVSASGQALCLPDSQDLLFASQSAVQPQEDGAFGNCAPESAKGADGFLLYLLSVGPASGFDQYAPMTGLGAEGKITGCGRRYQIEGVQFRLLKLDPQRAPGATDKSLVQTKALLQDVATSAPSVSAQTAKLSLLRSYLAHWCFGTDLLADLAVMPFVAGSGDSPGSLYRDYGFLNTMLASWVSASNSRMCLSDAEVPLALVCAVNGNLLFVDMWSVRRRTTPRWESGYGGTFVTERRIREGEAVFLQFQEQLRWLLAKESQLKAVKSTEYFRYLPAAGILPVGGRSAPLGFSPGAFFTGITLRDPAFMKGSAVPALLRQSFSYPAIDPSSKELVYLYRVDDNEHAFIDQTLRDMVSYRVFARGSMPFKGEARFDVSYWNYSTYA